MELPRDDSLYSDSSLNTDTLLIRRGSPRSRERPQSISEVSDNSPPFPKEIQFRVLDDPLHDPCQERIRVPDLSRKYEGLEGARHSRDRLKRNSSEPHGIHKRGGRGMLTEDSFHDGTSFGYQPVFRQPTTRAPLRPRLDDDRGHHAQGVEAQIKGLYLVRFAVVTTACYLAIQLLITFAEVLLPFIFAVLCMIILEPLKQFTMRILQRLAVVFFQKLNWNFCLETSCSAKRGDEAGLEIEGVNLYGRLPEEATGEEVPGTSMQPVIAPVPAVKRLTLATSILFCMLLTGRALWLTAKVFFRAGYTISGNLEYYRNGSTQLKRGVEAYINEIHIESLDYEKLIDGLVDEVENIGTVVTENVLFTGLQACVTLIFLIYMLWSPIKMESSTMTREVFTSTSRYLKVKCAISAVTGLSIAVLLWAIGLDLPAAFGLLSFLANFLPGIGSFVASVCPCMLAAIDIRKTTTQVLLALGGQVIVHICVDFLIEPVFFGISVEIHSVVVILGIWFFYEVWGVPGMLLSVPLLAVLRIMMKSMKNAAHFNSPSGDDVDSIIFLDNILEGRWMSSVGDKHSVEEFEMADLPIYPTAPQPAFPFAEMVGDPDALHGHQRRDGWSALLDGVHQTYQAHRLPFDCVALSLIMGCVLFAPL